MKYIIAVIINISLYLILAYLCDKYIDTKYQFEFAFISGGITWTIWDLIVGNIKL